MFQVIFTMQFLGGKYEVKNVLVEHSLLAYPKSIVYQYTNYTLGPNKIAIFKWFRP